MSMHTNLLSVANVSRGTELQRRRLAYKSPILAIFLGIFLPPLAYVYVGKYRLAVLNVITLNYFLMGIVVVPIQTRNAIIKARRESEVSGVPDP